MIIHPLYLMAETFSMLPISFKAFEELLHIKIKQLQLIAETYKHTFEDPGDTMFHISRRILHFERLLNLNMNTDFRFKVREFWKEMKFNLLISKSFYSLRLKLETDYSL